MVNTLIAIYSFPPRFSGAGLRALRLSERLNKKYGISFQVLCNDKHNAQEKISDVRVQRIKSMKEEGFFFPFYLIQIFVKTNIYLMKHKKDIDIIHFFSFSWMNRMIMLANILFYKKKTLLEVTLDGSDDPVSLLNVGKRNRILKKFTHFLLKRIDKFIVGSEYGLNSCISAGIDRDKVAIELRPCDEELFGKINFKKKNELRKKLGLPINKFILLNVGAIYPRKNQEFLVKCVESLRNKDILLILIGPSGKNKDYYVKLNGYIKKNKIENQVILIGEQKNVNEYMIASDLFVFASKKEGFPNTIAESIMSGLPVITTYLECLETFINEETGVMIRNDGNYNHIIVSEFIKFITLIYNGRKSFKRGRIRHFGIENFSAHKIDEEYFRIYQELTKISCS